ncbi:MAG: hypothetical protein Q9187_002297 [Circinaria calcarea]
MRAGGRRRDLGKGLFKAVKDRVSAGKDKGAFSLLGWRPSVEQVGLVGDRGLRGEKEREGRIGYLFGFVEADLAGCHAAVLEEVRPGRVDYGDVVTFVAWCAARCRDTVPGLSRLKTQVDVGAGEVVGVKLCSNQERVGHARSSTRREKER